MLKKKIPKLFLILVIILALLFWYTKFAGHHMSLQMDKVPENFWGATFSKKYAQELGLDWQETYLAILDDLKIKLIRLPIYWDDVEREQGVYDFADYDWMMLQGEERGVKFILNVGRRLPRWPECHQPGWTSGMNAGAIDNLHVKATQEAIRHFKKYESIEYWQLENEYFFPWFGECPEANEDLIREEISILRSEDGRPLILTDSGELNSWRSAAKYSDILGTTMYRVVWNNYFGYFRAPWPAMLYRIKAKIAGKKPAQMIVAELQAEPWISDFRNPTEVDRDVWEKSFSIAQLETNAELARRTGFNRTYLWGVEWWYWLKLQGDSSIWERAKQIFEF